MTHRGRLSLRLVELGFLALMGVAGATGAASAEPGQLNYVVLQDGNTSIVGNDTQVEHVRELRNGNEPILWFRDGGQEYVSRDRGLIGQIDQAWKPVNDIAGAQSKLADQQSKLADQQSKISEQMAALSNQQAELSSQEIDLSSRDDGSRSEAERRDLQRQRDQLRDRQRALQRQMKELDRPMRELSSKMSALGRDMSALGRKMNDASERAKLEVRGVLRRAIASGAVKPVH